MDELWELENLLFLLFLIHPTLIILWRSVLRWGDEHGGKEEPE